MEPDTSLNSTLITLALHYLADPILCLCCPVFTRIEPCQPTFNHAFLIYPQRAWRLWFDTQRSLFGASAQGNQIAVEIGQRNDVFSVERHSILPPVGLIPVPDSPITQPLSV